MPIELKCLCGRRLLVPDRRAGQSIRCPKCGESLTVPANESADRRSSLAPPSSTLTNTPGPTSTKTPGQERTSERTPGDLEAISRELAAAIGESKPGGTRVPAFPVRIPAPPTSPPPSPPRAAPDTGPRPPPNSETRTSRSPRWRELPPLDRLPSLPDPLLRAEVSGPPYAPSESRAVEPAARLPTDPTPTSGEAAIPTPSTPASHELDLVAAAQNVTGSVSAPGTTALAGAATSSALAEPQHLEPHDLEPEHDVEPHDAEWKAPVLDSVVPLINSGFPVIVQHDLVSQPTTQSPWSWPLGVAAMGCVAMLPAFLDLAGHFQAGANSPGLASWACLSFAVGVMQLAYSLYLFQLPDWSSYWSAAIALVLIATGYAMCFGLTLLGGPDSSSLAALDLAAPGHARRAAAWCLVMVMLIGGASYGLGLRSVYWRRGALQA